MTEYLRPKIAFIGLALFASSQLASGQTITPSMAAPAGSIDTSKPGFRMRIVQAAPPNFMTAANPAEALIHGKAIDPATGLPFENLADLSAANPDGTFDITGVINMNQDAGGSVGNFPNDDLVPGIPGTSGSTDNYVVEFTGWLQLPAGTVRLGVNSDDGFKLTIGNGLNPRDPGAVQNAILDGTRGAGNTDGTTMTVQQAGLYPFRLLWWENGGGSECEFYNFAPGTTSGTRYMVNDSTQANSIKVFRSALVNAPLLSFATPAGTSFTDPRGVGTTVPPAPLIQVEITDGSTAVNQNSVTLSLDGTALTPTVTKAGSVTSAKAQAPLLKASSVHTNVLVFADAAGTLTTNTWTFTVSNFPTIPAEYALSSVDTSKPGFKAKVYQMDVNRNPATGLVPNAERQLALGYNDPATGKPYPNTADLTGADSDGYFTDPDVINWNQDAPTPTGNFSSGSTPPFEDEPVPGITGNTSANTTERYVFSIETILDLKAGAYRFGVNSDDGFRLSAGRGPGDVVGVQLGTAGDRGATDTVTDFVIATDGFYPFRVMWWETGGGSSVEFFVVDLATGTKTLINDPTGKTVVKAYRESAASHPYISRTLPAVNYAYTFADQDQVIDITDGASAVDAASIKLTLNGAAQTITTTKSGKVTTVTRKGGVDNLLPSGVVNASLIYSFTEGGNAVSATNNWSFTVPRYLRPIPVGNKVPAAQVSGAGFHVRAFQIDRSKDSNQGNGGRQTGNNMPGPEIELASGYIDPTSNNPYPNLAAPGPNPDGSYDISDVLNFSNAQSAGGPANNAGIFNADTQVPGLPGTGSSNFGLDNSVDEFTTYLDLKAGAYIFGLNVDDGWTVISAPNVHDTLGTLLGFRDGPGGQNGNPANNPNAAFNVIVPEDGTYPMRVLFWEGGGGVNMEFFSIDRDTGTQILVNDTTGQFPSVVATSGNLNSSIVAHNTYSGPTKPWVKFSVYPIGYIGTLDPKTTTGGNVSLFQNRNQQSGPGPINVKLGLLNGSWNSGEVANSSTAQRPFGDAVGAVVADLGSGTVGMVLDGVNVTPTVTDVPNSTDKMVMFVPNPPLSSSSNHVAGLVYAGTTNYWTFSVITNVTVGAGIALPSNKADQSARGFHVKVVQATAARAGGNTAAAAEAQLAGTPASVAIPGPNADGSYTLPGIINWNSRKVPGQTGAEIGNFQTLLGGPADEPIPGLPGTGAARDNVAAEIFAYLDLPAGYQKFGVNGDDGWKVQIGTPGQTNGTVLFTIDRGAGAQDIPFAFITPEAGLYPVRLVWYQGGGDANLEFFTYGPNNTKIPINGTDPNAVKAYYNVQGAGVTPTISISKSTGGSVTITYTGTLQATDSLSSPNWQPVANAVSPFTVTASGGQRFFRAAGQ